MSRGAWINTILSSGVWVIAGIVYLWLQHRARRRHALQDKLLANWQSGNWASMDTEREHPTSEVLAAYAEKDVSASERDRIERHLTDCAACREVVTETSMFLEQEDRAREPTYTNIQVFGAFVLAAVSFAVLAWFASSM